MRKNYSEHSHSSPVAQGLWRRCQQIFEWKMCAVFFVFFFDVLWSVILFFSYLLFSFTFVLCEIWMHSFLLGSQKTCDYCVLFLHIFTIQYLKNDFCFCTFTLFIFFTCLFSIKRMCLWCDVNENSILISISYGFQLFLFIWCAPVARAFKSRGEEGKILKVTQPFRILCQDSDIDRDRLLYGETNRTITSTSHLCFMSFNLYLLLNAHQAEHLINIQTLMQCRSFWREYEWIFLPESKILLLRDGIWAEITSEGRSK